MRYFSVHAQKTKNNRMSSTDLAVCDTLSPFVQKSLDKILNNPSPNKDSNTKEKTNPAKIIPHYTGHRARLKERYNISGKDALQDYEFLELILGLAIPRRDVKPLAKTLLQEFGSIGNVIMAPAQHLKTLKGIGDNAIHIFRIICDSSHYIASDHVNKKMILSNWNAVSEYAQRTMGHLAYEEFHIWFLDQQCGLIKQECLSKGTINKAAIYPRNIVQKALDYNCSNVILLHNHPSGDTTPSGADIAVTTKIGDALGLIDINLFDHIIVARDHVTSFRNLGLLGG